MRPKKKKNMIYSSFGAIKFDIVFMALYFFENINFPLILKYLVYYLGWPLIATSIYDMLTVV